MGASYPLWNGFGIVGWAALNAIVGESKTRVDLFDDGVVTGRLRWDRAYVIAPNLNGRLGFLYAYQCGRLSIQGEVGYEIDHYWNAIRSRPILPENTARRVQDLGFAGPYAGLSVHY